MGNKARLIQKVASVILCFVLLGIFFTNCSNYSQSTIGLGTCSDGTTNCITSNSATPSIYMQSGAPPNPISVSNITNPYTSVVTVGSNQFTVNGSCGIGTYLNSIIQYQLVDSSNNPQILSTNSSCTTGNTACTVMSDTKCEAGKFYITGYLAPYLINALQGSAASQSITINYYLVAHLILLDAANNQTDSGSTIRIPVTVTATPLN